MSPRLRYILNFFLLFALPAGVHAQASPARMTSGPSDPYDLPIEEHVFENGLRLLVLERAGDTRVVSKIFTDFGSIVEEPGELGAAHFLEHLMFKGTKTLGTTNWEAERPIVERRNAAELELEEALNAARNDLRERGVWSDYKHAETTPKIKALQAEIAALDAETVQYADRGSTMQWYQAFGGTGLTATTEQEYMKFDINLPVERVELFLRVEADRMRNTVFRAFDEERMILVEQRLGDLNKPTTPFYEQLAALSGLVHPVFWPEGYLSDFKEYSRWYQRDLYDRYFQPNNTTLVFIGGVSLEQMIPMVDRYFSWMERVPEPTRARAVEPPPASERRLTYRNDDLPPRVEARHMIPGIGHPDRPAFDVVQEVLSMALDRELKAVGVSGTVDVNTRVVHTTRFGVPGTINTSIVTDESNLAAAEAVMVQVVEGLGTGPEVAADLRLAQKRLKTAWLRTVRNPDLLAFDIGHFQIMDRWQTLEAHMSARDDVTVADLRRISELYFVPDNRSWGVVRPRTTSRPVSDQEEL